MSKPFMPGFHAFPNQAAIIGRLITGYGEIEYAFANLVMLFVKPAPVALKAIFRLRATSQRLDTCDAYLYHNMRKVGLLAEYDEAYQAVKYCHKVRNRYAHCHWKYDKNGISFTNLEEAAEKRSAFPKMKFNPAELKDLKAQEAYFAYTLDIIDFTGFEASQKLGDANQNPISRPVKMQMPT